MITVAEGDGIGPEIMAATLHILEEAGANIEIQKVEIGEKVYLRGESAGIDNQTWDKIRHSKAFLKAPITTPQGGGFKSLNVTIRTSLGLYANVRPCVAYSPYVETKHPGMNVVVIRENEEDLYTGIEYRHTPEYYQALKIITVPGCEKIIRFAFEYALSHDRKKVTCFTKDNILKLSDGEFHRVFREIGEEYPQIEKEHWIIDIGAAKLADTPGAFDVIVLPNLYGDILSDVAAQIAGSVGMAGSANIGTSGAMFEAIHGSAPRRAGQDVANPSGLILASVLMLVHIDQPKTAGLIHNAWLKTIEEGIHTYDIFKEKTSKKKVGTQEFAKALIDRLGQVPNDLPQVHYSKAKHIHGHHTPPPPLQKDLMGVDIFVQWSKGSKELADKLISLAAPGMKLTMIGNRGVKVWPNPLPETSCGDCWRCRFMHPDKKHLALQQIVDLLGRLAENSIDVTQTQSLYNFDHKPGYTVAQDEQ